MRKEYVYIDAPLMTEALDGLFAIDSEEASHICDIVERLVGGFNLQTSVSFNIDRDTMFQAYVGKIVAELAKDTAHSQNRVNDLEIKLYESEWRCKTLSNNLSVLEEAEE